MALLVPRTVFSALRRPGSIPLTIFYFYCRATRIVWYTIWRGVRLSDRHKQPSYRNGCIQIELVYGTEACPILCFMGFVYLQNKGPSGNVPNSEQPIFPPFRLGA